MRSQSSPRPEITLSLADAVGLGSARVGSKAANLAELLALGLPIPAGFVIPADAFEHWKELEPALLAAADELGDEAFAVRSSASAEDLEGASYAGQYDTVLDVSRDGLTQAVRDCWESGASRRVAAYAAGLPAGDPAPQTAMAVLVQRMVRAQAAGVAFSANPMSGARDEVMVTAVNGLGERLVSGEAVGDEWLIRHGEASCSRVTEKAINSQQALAIAALTRRVADHFGSPQDEAPAISRGSTQAARRVLT